MKEWEHTKPHAEYMLEVRHLCCAGPCGHDGPKEAHGNLMTRGDMRRDKARVTTDSAMRLPSANARFLRVRYYVSIWKRAMSVYKTVHVTSWVTNTSIL